MTEPAPQRSSRRLVIVAVVAALVGVLASGPIDAAIDRVSAWMASDDHGHDGPLEYFTCGMHPWVILPKAGDCPICFMALTPLDPDKFTGEIAIDPVVTQNMGVRIAEATKGAVTRTLRTVGTVSYDESRVRDINLKVAGWLEKLHVDHLGAPVAAGEPLFDLYSPELYSAQEEYLAAFRRAGGTGRDLLEAARTRLRYFDITDAQIAELEAKGSPTKAMTMTSPWPGTVVAKHANEGMNAHPGMQLYRIADLSKVWVMVTLYEYQLPYVGIGHAAVMTLPYIPGVRFEGRVIYVYPYLDEKTHEVRARVEFDNPHQLLKPGMFADIEIRSTLAEDRVLVPSEAVIDTGERQVAFVSLGEGRFEPRDLVLGVEADGGRVEVISGVEPGEMVVTSGQFLLDSEARIREGIAKMIKGELAADQAADVAVEGASELTSLPADVDQHLTALLSAVLDISDGLAGDSAAGVAGHAERAAQAATALLGTTLPDDPHFWHRNAGLEAVRDHAERLTALAEIADVRVAFAELAAALDPVVMATGIPPGLATDVQRLRCPMYREEAGGAWWLQRAGSARNPYYGSGMLECFDERATVPRTGGAKPKAAAAPAAPPPPVTLDLPREPLEAALTAYLALQELLAADRADGAEAHLEALRKAAGELKQAGGEPVAAGVAKIERGAAGPVTDLAALRVRFRDLSDGLIAVVDLAGPDATVRVAHCPMAKASWLQRGADVSNPYYGSEMLSCGSIQRTLEPR